MRISKLISSIVMLIAFFIFSQPIFSATANNVKCNGCVDAKDIAKNAVTKSKIKNNSVTTSKIKNGAVTPDKLSSGAYGVTVRMSYSSSDPTSTYGSEVVHATCKSGETLISATCDCTGNLTQNPFGTNIGAVWMCYVYEPDNSVSASCWAVDANSGWDGPAVTAYAFCSTSGSQLNVQASSIQSKATENPDENTIMPPLEVQKAIDSFNAMKSYYDQKILEVAQ